MKCIKLIKASKGHEIGQVLRVNDDEADLRVKGGYWSFAPKTEYKLYKNPDYKTKRCTTFVKESYIFCTRVVHLFSKSRTSFIKHERRNSFLKPGEEKNSKGFKIC